MTPGASRTQSRATCSGVRSSPSAARTTASDDDWPAAYARLDQWVRDRGCTRAGPKRELLTTDPFSGACRLEILFPIEA